MSTKQVIFPVPPNAAGYALTLGASYGASSINQLQVKATGGNLFGFKALFDASCPSNALLMAFDSANAMTNGAIDPAATPLVDFWLVGPNAVVDTDIWVFGKPFLQGIVFALSTNATQGTLTLSTHIAALAAYYQ